MPWIGNNVEGNGRKLIEVLASPCEDYEYHEHLRIAGVPAEKLHKYESRALPMDQYTQRFSFILRRCYKTIFVVL
jgi:hypothetical protein